MLIFPWNRYSLAACSLLRTPMLPASLPVPYLPTYGEKEWINTHAWPSESLAWLGCLEHSRSTKNPSVIGKSQEEEQEKQAGTKEQWRMLHSNYHGKPPVVQVPYLCQEWRSECSQQLEQNRAEKWKQWQHPGNIICSHGLSLFWSQEYLLQGLSVLWHNSLCC